LESPQVYQRSYFSRQPAQIVNTQGNILCNSEINVGTPGSVIEREILAFVLFPQGHPFNLGVIQFLDDISVLVGRKFNGCYLIHFSLYSLGLEESIMGILRLCPPIGQKNLPTIFHQSSVRLRSSTSSCLRRGTSEHCA